MSENELVYPYDEGRIAASKNIPPHKNPYKCPNITRTDLVKSDAWINGYNSYKIEYLHN